MVEVRFFIQLKKKSNSFRREGISKLPGGHIVPCGKFHRIRGAPPETFPSEKYVAPEEVGGNRKCFESPIRKRGLL